jgi:hypothetical protein
VGGGGGGGGGCQLNQEVQAMEGHLVWIIPFFSIAGVLLLRKKSQ